MVVDMTESLPPTPPRPLFAQAADDRLNQRSHRRDHEGQRRDGMHSPLSLCRCRRPSGPTDIVVVLDVMAQLVNRDGRKSGFDEEALGRLATPHRAETIAALCQR